LCDPGVVELTQMSLVIGENRDEANGWCFFLVRVNTLRFLQWFESVVWVI